MTERGETAVPASSLRPRLRLLPAFLFDTDQPKALYLLKAWLLALLPSIGLAAIVGSFAGEARAPDFGAPGPLLLFLLVGVTPVVETLIMTPPLLLLNRVAGPGPAIVVSAIGWGIAHSLQAPAWGFIIWWPFLVFSSVLLVWREKSIWSAMLMVMAIHALQNAVPGTALLLSAR